MKTQHTTTPTSFHVGLFLLAAAVTYLVAGCGSGMPNMDMPAKITGNGLIHDVSEGGVEHVPVELSDVLARSDKKVVVDFWAHWCGPCTMLSEELDEVADQLSDTHVIVKVNVDENPELASHFQVTAIPDVRVFQGGRFVSGFRGYRSADRVVEAVK